MATHRKDARIWLLLIAIASIVADRLSKLWIMANVPSGTHRTIIPKVFYISHVLNTGAAFSIFADSMSPNTVRIALIVFSIFAVIVVGALLWRVGQALTLTSVALALILGGAIGNLYERIQLSHVTDFLEVHIYHYHYPDFNIADSCIVVGACLLLLEMFRPQRTEHLPHDAH